MAGRMTLPSPAYRPRLHPEAVSWLASPDIPAETLLSNRGNFLASALSRFQEAYLFSNEGDEVLRQISTLANYFPCSRPKAATHGFRLGNVEILSVNSA